MGSKFEGFEGCFSMSLTTHYSLQRLRDMNDRRKQLEIKIAKGTVTRADMVIQLKAELQLFDTFLENIDSKKKARECRAKINIVISTLTKRINNMWNTIFLFFAIDDEVEPEYINVSNSIIMNSCSNCSSCNVTIKSIIGNVEKISIQENAIFNFSSSDFIKILQTTVFVDKTLMIKELFCNKRIRGTVVTAPRKYGKSTNLSMLKYFLEIQLDSLGKPLTKANAGESITDTSNFELFKRLNIMKEADIMDNHFGKYPVLYANFKIEKCIKSYFCVIEGCKEIVHKSFLLHNYLLESSKLSEHQKELFKLWYDDTSYKNFKNVDDIVIGLKSLCSFLTTHYNKSCFVLIDELDFFTETVTITETLLKDYKLIILFLKRFLSFLKNSRIVVHSFMTGKSAYAIHNIVPLCVQIQPFYNFHCFTKYYGLTENELESIFKKSEFKHVLITIQEVKAYYGSYNKIDQTTKSKTQIYCIWSILNVLKCKRLDNYWRDFGNVFCNFSNPTINDVMKRLLINKFVMIVLYNKAARKVYSTPPIIVASETPTKNSIDYFFNLMLDLGYLTCNSITMTIIDVYTNTNSCVGYVSIPNQEVGRDIENKISLLS